MTRLRRSDCSSPGITRRRAGKAFYYLDSEGQRIRDEDVIDRIKGLVIPPAWKEVWICPLDQGHIQATGIDDAGRKQYLYHEKWSETRSARKFESMLDFAMALPRLRRAVASDIDPDEASRLSVLACGVRLIELGHFRIGSERYAEENETFGAATVTRDHVELGPGRDEVTFEYVGKGSLERRVTIRDGKVRGVSRILLRRRSGPEDFLAYKDGRRWRDISSDDINEYIREHAGETFSAKDFRTWNGTVMAAVELARGDLPGTARGRDRRIRRAVEAVAEELGNTPAVARDSYISPRLLDLYRNGQRIELRSASAPIWSRTGLSKVEKRVLELLD